MAEIEYLNSEPIKESINKLSNNVRTERNDLENEFMAGAQWKQFEFSQSISSKKI
jgi:hypothetical protein